MSAGKRLPGTPEPMHHWKGAGGVIIAGDSWGDPNGPLVLLQHGGGQTRHAWKGAGETLGEAGYHAIAFDARGHGDSSWAPDGDYGQDADGRRPHLRRSPRSGNRRPVLVGASMGGGTSLVAVGEDRVDATALVLVDIAPRIEPEGVEKIRAFMGQKPDGFESLEEVADAIASYQPHRQRPSATSTGWPRTCASATTATTTGTGIRASAPASATRAEAPAALEACAAQPQALPTLLVRGGLSDILSEEGAAGVPRAVPERASTSTSTGAGHMVAGDRNDIFAGAVIEFLHRVVPVGGAPVKPPHATSPHHVGPPGDVIDVP